MSDEGLSVTRRWFETWNRGDLDAFIELYAPDAELTPPASWVEAGTIKGRPAIRRFFEGLREAWAGEDVAVHVGTVHPREHAEVPRHGGDDFCRAFAAETRCDVGRGIAAQRLNHALAGPILRIGQSLHLTANRNAALHRYAVN